jgi:hypothetical protein
MGSFKATGSGGTLPHTFEWDLDGDGQYDDAVGATVSYHFPGNGSYGVAVRLTDGIGCQAFARTDVTVAVPDPNVTITKTVDKAVIHAGETVVYSYVVTNNGQCPLLNVTLRLDAIMAVAARMGCTWPARARGMRTAL